MYLCEMYIFKETVNFKWRVVFDPNQTTLLRNQKMQNQYREEESCKLIVPCHKTLHNLFVLTRRLKCINHSDLLKMKCYP